MKSIIAIFALQFFLIFATAQAVEADYQTIENISYYEQADITDDYQKERCVLDLYYPADMDSFATVVWFHGGGIRGGEKFMPVQLENKGIAVLAVNYRLYPKVKNPVYIEDAAASVAWAFKHIEEYGGMKDRIFVSGHSAGGYLTSMIGLDTSYLQKHDVDANDIAGLIPFSGHAITHFTVREERGIDGKQVVVDKYAPIALIRNDAPPYTIITADRDMELLGRYEENAFMWRMMQLIEHPDCTLYELEGYHHGDMYVPALGILLKEIKRILGK